MLKAYHYILLTLTILLSCLGVTRAQMDTTLARQIREQFNIVTDRDKYCVGENIQFYIFNKSPQQVKNNNWSSVIYLELIKYNGEALVQQKYNLTAHGASGNLVLPRNIESGNYYLRAYTRWMRNFDPADFAYKLVTIVNPYNDKPLTGDESSGCLFEVSQAAAPIHEPELLPIKSYKQREPVSFNIDRFVAENNIQSEVCIAVSKADNYQNYQLIQKEHQPINYPMYFLPEPNGISISGKVTDKDTKEPAAFANVNITILSEAKEQRTVLTNNDGRFFIELPTHFGETEIFGSVSSNLSEKDLKINIDNDFYTTPIALPYIPIDHNSGYAALNSLAQNYQLQDIYAKKDELKVPVNQATPTDTLPFYGLPVKTIFLKNFIAMPTLADYFNELLPNVKIVNKNKKYGFRITGPYSELDIYPPLVMIDMVVITDINWLLALSPDHINRIEVVDKPYYYGNLIHGGIISVFSKHGDFGGRALAESGLFFNYHFFNQTVVSKPNTTAKHIPQLNNTLYWDTIDLTQTPENINFSSGDLSGRFTIKLTGINNKGEMVNTFTYFDVE